MNAKPAKENVNTQTAEFLKIIVASFRHYLSVLKKCWLLILILMLCRESLSFFPPASKSIVLDTVFLGVFSLIILYFFSVTLHMTHSCIFKKEESMASAFSIVLKKFWKIVITAIVFSLLFLLVFYAGLHFLTIFLHHFQNKGSITVILGYFFVFILPLMIYLGFFFLTLPIAIVKNLSLVDTYKKSFTIGKSNAMKMVLAFLVLVILIFSVHPETIFFPIFNNQYLAYFADMIYCFVVYPFLFSFLVCFLKKTEQKANDQV